MNQRELLTVVSEKRSIMGDPRSDPRVDFDAYKASLGVKRDDSAIRVVVFMGEPGVGTWRVFYPFCELAKDPRFDIRVTWCATDDDVTWSDVCWVQRSASQSMIACVERAQRLGKKVVFELDDLIDHGVIPHFNPARQILDKTDHIACTLREVEIADCVVVSTQYLKTYYAGKAKRVEVLENCVNPELWENLDDPHRTPFHSHDGVVTIGWGGSTSHWDDVAMVAPAIKAVMDEHPNVWFVRIGYSGPDFRPNEQGQNIVADPFAGIPHDRRFSIGWEPHAHTLAAKYEHLIDIGVAPLVYSPFSRSKSNIKLIQGWLAGSAMVASDIECYNADRSAPVRLVKNNRIDRWIGALEELVEDRDQRLELGQLGRQYVLEHFDIRKRIHGWADLLLSLGHQAQQTQSERYAELQAAQQPAPAPSATAISLENYQPVLQKIAKRHGWKSAQVSGFVTPNGWAVVTILPSKEAA
jgi:glycosyltransferase involved in cell wall biosynthesis